MALHAYDLWFESGDAAATYPAFPPGRFATRPRLETAPDGWIGSFGPAIAPTLWPRHPDSGEPMIHGITLRLPADYQLRGAEFPGVSYFQGSSPDFTPFSSSEPAPDQEPAGPRIQLRPDIVGGYGVLLWLSEEELTGTKTQATGYLGSLEESRRVNPPWFAAPPSPVWLTARVGDPNVGRSPRDYWQEARADDGYINPYQHPEFGLLESDFAGRSHLGGTSFPAQSVPEGLSPFYLEIDELPGLNFGDGGNAQIDLATDVYDWACA